MSNEKGSVTSAETTNIEINGNLATLFVDGVQVAVRRDGVFLLRFTSHLPEAHREQVRMMVTKDSMRQILDVMCRQVGHYPEKMPAAKNVPANPVDRKRW